MATDPDITPDGKDWTWVMIQPCPECGFDASQHPKERLGAEVRALAPVFRGFLGRADVAERPSPGVWSALEYSCHVRDVFKIYDERLNLMLREDGPTFLNWDQDETAVAEHYGRQDPGKVAYGLGLHCGRLADAFDRVHGSQWERTGYRSDGASYTIASFGKYLLHDPVHHVWDIEAGNEVLARRET
jgi:hypothetical protein